MPVRSKRSPRFRESGPAIEDHQGRVWALRALLVTPARTGFFKESSFIKSEVLEAIGLSDLPQVPDHSRETTLDDRTARLLLERLQTDHAALRRHLAALTNLTPGDFAVVVRQLRVLGKTPTQAGLLAALRQECEAKPDRPRPIGFAG
ncbi:MAG: hypothetical protein HQL99_06125 [Magnetococcales bacterium]|nr:hypothetical protein [Magnetococcales bacterium]